MKTVFVANNPQEAYIIKALLDADGIETVIENEDLYPVRGGIPMAPETLPRVKILDDADFERARQLIGRRAEGPETGARPGGTPERMTPLTPGVQRSSGALYAVSRYVVVLVLGIALGAFLTGTVWEKGAGQDRNRDGKQDVFAHRNLDLSYDLLSDNNFDGEIDEVMRVDSNDIIRRLEVDADFDGNFDIFADYSFGRILVSRAYRDGLESPVVEMHYENSILEYELVDEDEDGDFDVRHVYDPLGRRVRSEPIRDPGVPARRESSDG